MRGYDYARIGAYCVTIRTYDRLHVFGRVMDEAMCPSPLGQIVQRCWDAIPEHMPHTDVGAFVAMPNHVHGVVVIRERLVDVQGHAGGVATVWAIKFPPCPIFVIWPNDSIGDPSG